MSGGHSITDAVLIGAGGHAKGVVEIALENGIRVAAYVSPDRSDWLDGEHVSSDERLLDERETDLPRSVVMGLGGTTPGHLSRRLGLLRQYLDAGFSAPTLCHKTSVRSHTAICGKGTIVLANAVIQASVRLGIGVIINTAAIIEHDCSVGDGTHIGPGAIVLGGCHVGRCCMIGAGAVVLPGTVLDDNSLVPAAVRYPQSM